MKIKTLAACAAAAMLLASCSSHRSPLTYFQDIDTAEAIEKLANSDATAAAFQPKIVADDELVITISSVNPAATAAYNLPLSNPARRSNLLTPQTPQQQTYIVDSKGDITMPLIGRVHVEGLTCEQVADKIVELISPDVADPSVMVRLLNFRVNVAGEVKQPGPQTITGERYSILDALSAAGDLTEFGERNNVLLVRENNGKREAHRLNLNSAELLTSPYFYLQQNDYVYVEPNKIRKDNSKYNQNNAFKLSVISAIVGGVSSIASLIVVATK